MGRTDITQIIKKEKRNILVSLFVGFVIAFIFALNSTRIYARDVQRNIADSVVRFHVLANSDTKDDQELKLKVRDAVLEGMKHRLENSGSIEETEEIINSNIEYIKEISLNTIEEQGYDYDVNVFMSEELFPLKTYGDTVFPAGMYNALRIEIGAAQGYNWWCVMFPPLCFADATCDELTPESKEKLKNILPEEEYKIITSPGEKAGAAPKIKFKVVELWQETQCDKKLYVTKS